MASGLLVSPHVDNSELQGSRFFKKHWLIDVLKTKPIQIEARWHNKQAARVLESDILLLSGTDILAVENLLPDARLHVFYRYIC